MRVMSAGDGYKYLLRTVAAGDGDRPWSTPLTRYYAEAGTPPGRWLGSGLPGLGGGEIVEGGQVFEAQLELLLGLGRDPVTGEPLGRAYPAYVSVADRVAERIAALDPKLGVLKRAEASAAIEAEDAQRGLRRAVAGYDFTFSLPKSASVLWALADAPTQALIADAHHAAVAEVLGFMERELAATRSGATSGDGAVAQVDVTGLVAVGFDHFDSRAGDPQLQVVDAGRKQFCEADAADSEQADDGSLLDPGRGIPESRQACEREHVASSRSRARRPKGCRRVPREEPLIDEVTEEVAYRECLCDPSRLGQMAYGVEVLLNGMRLGRQ